MRRPDPPSVRLPAGQYAFVTGGIPWTYGGLTASMLARAQAFARQAGVPVTILTTGHGVGVGRTTAALRARRVLPRSSRIRNAHQDYARRRYPDQPAPVPPRPVPRWSLLVPDHEPTRVGRHLVRLRDPDGGRVVCEEYRRPDGTAYLRRHLPDAGHEGEVSSAELVECLDRAERVRETHPGMAAWHRAWAAQVLSGPLPAYVVLDAAEAAADLMTSPEEGWHLFPVMHNAHLRTGHGPLGTLHPQRAHLLHRLAEADGLIVLTASQARDVEERMGPRSNVYVVPHATHPLPRLPDPARRDPATVVLVARLSGQKRVEHTLRAFAHVVREVPGARLEIFGSGPREATLKQLSCDLGLGRHVTFHGYVRSATRRFRTATLSVLSSVREGQALVVQEAMSAGCPMVAYDIRYGPVDMIEDGRTGLLVPDGDVDALGAAMVRVIRDRALQERLSRATWERSRGLDQRAMVQRWAEVFTDATRQRPRRTTLGELRVDRVDVDQFAADELVLEATLTVEGDIPVAGRPDARPALLLRPRGADRQLRVPADVLSTELTGTGAVLTVRVRVGADRLRGLGGPGQVLLDLHAELVWNNDRAQRRVPAPDPVPPTQGGLTAYATGAGNLSLKLAP